MKVVSELVGVFKRFGERELFGGLDFGLQEGEMVAVTGPSGSGKSTLLNMVGLLDSPDEGQIRILNADAPRPRSFRATRYHRHHLGYLFQNFALIDDHTVSQNLEVALAYAKDRSKKQYLIAEALERVGLRAMEHQKVFNLSGGEQQRVAIARLLLKPCEIVLADEPTGSLDSGNRDLVLDLLCELNSRGKSILIATHDAQVAQVCSRAVSLGELKSRLGGG